MQNSLDLLFRGIATSLRDDVLPVVGDDYARAQLSAAIELLGNIAVRVEWRADQLALVSEHAGSALDEFLASHPDAAGELGETSVGAGPTEARDHALRRISEAIRWCDQHGLADAERRPLLEFAAWHLEHELTLLRTGMFTTRPAR